jgi:phytanoyl-CoA hydroxylase
LTGKKLYALTPEQVQFYRENGYLLLKSVFTREEAQYLRDEAHALIHRLAQVYSENGINAAWGSAREVTSLPTQLLHCHNAQYHSAAFSRLMLDPRLTDRIADLIGENIQLHHTKLFIKPPEKGAPFPMHQDYPYFPHEKHTMLAAIVHFDDAPIEKGCVCVVPGSHKLGPLEHDPQGGWHLPVEDYPLEKAMPVPAEAGDVDSVQLPDHSWLRRQHDPGGAHHSAYPDARPDRPPDSADAPFAGARADVARHRPRSRRGTGH